MFGLIRELFGYARAHKKWWLVPLLVVLALLAILVVVVGPVAPLIYPFF